MKTSAGELAGPVGTRQGAAPFQPLDGRSGIEPSAFLAMLGLPLLAAILLGGLVVFGEIDALIACVSLLACAFILIDFRFGVVCLVVLMPLSASSLFPHSMGGIIGLNPLNLLLIATLISRLLRGSGGVAPARFSRHRLVWLYVVPIVIAGVVGLQHQGQIPAELTIQLPDFKNANSYLVNIVAKPLFIILFSLLVAAAAARSKKPETLVIPMLVSVWAMCLLTIAFVFQSGASLAQLSSSGARTFFSPLGIHANDLGRLYAIAYALMLFTFAATRDNALRLLLAVSMGLVVVALTLTFSRSSFFGFIVVNLLFLLSRRKLTTLLLSCVLLLALAFLMPDAVLGRISTGWGNGLNAISSGRVDEIWAPLLPEIWLNPVFGNGLASIAWSNAMRGGTILVVGHPHNAYLGALLDMGIVGLVLLCAYFMNVWRAFRRLSVDPALDPTLRGFYAGAAAGLVSFLLAGFFGSSLTPCLEQIFLWLAIGMMYGQRRTDATAPANGSRTH